MATVTKTYADAEANPLAGTVEFAAYTVAGGRPVRGAVLVATINPTTGVMSQALTNGAIYAVTERVHMRSTRESVIVAGSSNGQLDAQARYGDVVFASLFTSGGTPGEDGAGVPTGGAEGQILAKASAADFDTEWVTPA